MLAFIPREGVNLNDTQTKALLTYLNSSFTQLYIESIGRITGLGVVALEVDKAKDLPVLDVASLKSEDLKELASLFDILDTEARKISGADKKGNCLQLWDTIIAEIDGKITKIFQLPEHLAEATRTLAKIMMERRLARTEQPQPTIIKGRAELPEIKKSEKRPRKRTRKTETSRKNMKLDEFT